MSTKIILGTDHRGYALKEKIKSWLPQWGYQCDDKGAFALDSQDDYPDFIVPVGRLVSLDASNRGIILGHSGQGEAMLANKFPGVRAIVYYGGPLELIRLSRAHNDANVLSLGASFLDEEVAQAAIKLWLETPYSGEARHNRRLDKVAEYDHQAAWGEFGENNGSVG